MRTAVIASIGFVAGACLGGLYVLSRPTQAPDISRAVRAVGTERDTVIAGDPSVRNPALLTELAALNPERAAETALSLNLDPELLGAAFALWAEDDPDAAVARIASIAGAAGYRRRAAVALLEALDSDESLLERLVAALPVADAGPLREAWLAQLARRDPRGALTVAAAINEPSLQSAALTTVANAWAAQDPVGGLAAASGLGSQMADSFVQMLVIEWARLDRAGYVAWLRSEAQPDHSSLQGLDYLQISDPEWVINALESIGGDAILEIQARAIGTLARTDRDAATAIFDSTAPGSLRDLMADRILRSLSESDPAAAVAWLDRIDSPPPNAIMTLANLVAVADYSLMLQLVDRLPGNDATTLMTVSMSTIDAMARHPERIPEYAELLLVREDLASRQVIGRVVADWLDRDMDAALAWVHRQSAALDQSALMVAAQRMADSDYRAAAEFAPRIPEPQRSGWVTQAAQAFAGADAEGAAQWVAQYRGQDYYIEAMAEVVMAAAETDQSQSATLLERYETSEDLRARIKERIAERESAP